MSGLIGVRGRVLAAVMLGAFLVVELVAGPVAAQTVLPQTVAQKIAASKDLLDIDTATAAQLKALPGMGDAYVQRIVAGRPCTAKNQLTTRGILPPTAYEQIKALIIAHRTKK